MDDTLYLERDYVWSGFRSVGEWARRRLGIPDLADVAWDAFVNGARGTIFNLALQRSGIDPKLDPLVNLERFGRFISPEIPQYMMGQVRKAMARQGNVINVGSTETAQTYFKSEMARYAKLVKKAGIEQQ